MKRIEINVVTGERQEIALTQEEIIQAQDLYQQSLALQPTKEQKIAAIEAQINALQEQLNNL